MAAETPPPARGRRTRLAAATLTVVALGAAVVVVFGTGFGRDPSVVESALIDRPAPPLSGPGLDGEPVDVDDHRGKVVLVNVWASWCEACRSEHPILAATQDKLGPRGLQIIGIDMSDTRDDALAFLDEMGGANYPSVFDPDATRAVEWGTFAVPETYVVDRDGTIVQKAVGPVTAEWLAENVVLLLDE
ncbi:MAG: TlpA family protein disulfide reductase [Jiangellaceae bacterium]